MHMQAPRGANTMARSYVMHIVEFSLCEGPMELHERVYDIDDVWRFAHHPENDGKDFELIDGEIIEIVPGPGVEYMDEFAIRLLAALSVRYLSAEENNLGIVRPCETGYHPAGRSL